MGTIADKLNKLRDTKERLRDALIEKGQSVADTEPFSVYPDKVLAISSGAGPAGEPDPAQVYRATRPADWLTMPEPADDEMYLLVHIPEGLSSLVAFTATCTGDYTVALGTAANGQFVQKSAASVTSGKAYEAELFADDFEDLTCDGFKQAMVKVSGTDILTWEPSAHSKKTSPVNFAGWNIVEIACRLPKGTMAACGNRTANLALQKLKYFSWFGKNDVTDTSYMFYNCYSLAAVPHLDTASAANMSYMFGYCYSLNAVARLDTANAADMSGMFFNCFALSAVAQMDTAKVADMSYMFSRCYSLSAIPQLDTANVTDMSYMFDYCYSLRTVPQLDTANVTNMRAMFEYCYSLCAVPQLDTSNVTNMAYMFSNCASLNAVAQLDTAKVSGMAYAFSRCYSLAELELNSAVTGWTGYDIDLTDCSFTHQALVDLFNSLPAISSQRLLTVVGNPGAGALTSAEAAIVTGKGWNLVRVSSGSGGGGM